MISHQLVLFGPCHASQPVNSPGSYLALMASTRRDPVLDSALKIPLFNKLRGA